jgi:hypothetical protein
MSIAIPRWLTFWLVGAGLVGATLALIVAIRSFTQVRRAGYYIVREAARRTALRASLLFMVLVLLTVVVPFIPRQAPAPDPTLTPTPYSSPTPTPTRTTPMPTATSTPTPLPTATEPFIPTSTPQPTLPITFTAAFSLAVAPPADARITLWTLAQGVDENSRPVGAATQFSEGIERIYLFFTYDGLLPNVPVTVLWYHEGELLSGGTELWESQRSRGERYVYLTPSGGYQAGQYEVQVWLGDRLQIRTFFSVGGGR